MSYGLTAHFPTLCISLPQENELCLGTKGSHFLPKCESHSAVTTRTTEANQQNVDWLGSGCVWVCVCVRVSASVRAVLPILTECQVLRESCHDLFVSQMPAEKWPQNDHNSGGHLGSVFQAPDCQADEEGGCPKSVHGLGGPTVFTLLPLHGNNRP